MKTARTAQAGAAGEGVTGATGVRGVMGVSDTAAAADVGDTMTVDDVPTSFGVFKPVGYVMMGLPTQGQSEALVVALQGAGWQGSALLHFTPRESTLELEAMVDNAGISAKGFDWLSPSSLCACQCQLEQSARADRAGHRAWRFATPLHA